MSLFGFILLWLAVYLMIASVTKNRLKRRFIVTLLLTLPLAFLVFWKTFDSYLLSF